MPQRFFGRTVVCLVVVCLSVCLTAQAAENKEYLARPEGAETTAGWVKYKNNPVVFGDNGTVNDPYVLKEGDTYRMWHTWWNDDPTVSLSLIESKDGINWTKPKTILAPNPKTDWEHRVDRARLVKRGDTYHMWYTGHRKKSKDGYSIGYATSKDGWNWRRMSDRPVLEATLPWEKPTLMCPSVVWDEKANQYQMWYCAGDSYEPDVIGYATSPDGINWTKPFSKPVFTADPNNEWEQSKVGGGYVTRHGDWYLMFYIGFRDRDHAAIGLARSKDGINWQRHPQNPIICPTKGGFDSRACYTSCVAFDGQKWLLWYNGANGWPEEIGLVTHEGEDLGFDEKPSR